ncbi:RPL23B [Symbiodinium microadriaticum]|nr:RPL23B [Symbiodinium microadriaticum]
MASFAPLRRSRGLALLVLSLPLCCFVSAWGTARGRRVEYQARHAAPEPAEPELASPAWEESAQVVLEIVEDSTKEDALDWLQAGYAWTAKSRRFWRKLRSPMPPEPEAVRRTARWLQDKGLAQKAWVRRFPEVLGLSVEDLEEGRSTAPSYLKSEDTYNKAIKSNPTLLGKNYDCLQEHESCQGRCSRCWNT